MAFGYARPIAVIAACAIVDIYPFVVAVGPVLVIFIRDHFGFASYAVGHSQSAMARYVMYCGTLDVYIDILSQAGTVEIDRYFRRAAAQP